MDSQTAVANTPFKNLYNQWVLGRPWLMVLLMAVLVLFFAMHAKEVKIDASADALVLEGDKDLDFYREIVDHYDAREWLVIAYQPKQPLLSDASLDALTLLVEDLKQVPGVYSVMSLLDVPLLYSPKVAITSLSSSTQTLRNKDVDRKLAAIELRESPIYKNLISSYDGSTAALQINLQRDEQYRTLLKNREQLRALKLITPLNAEQQSALKKSEQAFKAYSAVVSERQRSLVANVREIIAVHNVDANKMYLGGVPMIANDMVTFVKNDLQTFGAVILVFIVVLLAVIFRSIRWVLLPLLACVLTNIFMLGLLGWLDWRMTVVSSNFVALLLIITLAISIHLVVRYRELEALCPSKSSRELTLETVSFMLKPCLYTSLTTIVAFMSLIISGIRPIIDFGWMMTLGISMALLVAFIVVPVGMVLSKNVSREEGASERTDDSAVFTYRFARITEKYGKLIVAVSLILFIAAIFGLLKLKVENRFIDYFDQGTEIYQGMELIDSQLGGTIPLDIILFSSVWEDDKNNSMATNSEEDDFAEDFSDDFGDDFDDVEISAPGLQSAWFTRAGLEKISAIHRHVDGLPETGKVLSLATIYEVADDLLGGGVDDIQLAFAYKSLPDSIRESMILPYLNAEHNEARIAIRVKETSLTLNRAELLDSLHKFMQDDLGYTEDQYRFTGMLVLYNNMLQSLFKSQILTLGVVFVAIVIMLTILFNSLMLSLICVTPNILAALLVLGGMGWAGLPLDMMTITIAAISVGIGVDNTIHYVHRFIREFAVDRNYLKTMYRCHGSIGRAMYYTSIIIIFGFSILMLSNFKPSIYFGLLTGAAMLSALLGALMLLPRLLILIKPLGVENSQA